MQFYVLETKPEYTHERLQKEPFKELILCRKKKEITFRYIDQRVILLQDKHITLRRN